MGYALEYDEDIGDTLLNVDRNAMHGMTLTQIATTYVNSFTIWMNENLGVDNWCNTSYDEPVMEQWFKAFYVISFSDDNHNGICDTGEYVSGFHWYYQTKTGDWAEKFGSGFACHLRSGTASTVPLAHWLTTIINPDIVYSYGYFQIRDIRNEDWRD